ncbi:MAG: class I SAM-dependent methyltransferase [Candidatus Margulisbacteria bacterium]|nr:class I SAM-dependent methyltransferase [Candidatus Margulisiibacteriota bacterium]
MKTEKEAWNKVKDFMADRSIELGGHWSYNLYNDPKRLVFVLSRYKFAAKMAAKNKTVLELGCSEGIGAPILSEFAAGYTGVDLDGDAIAAAKRNWASEKVDFIAGDFLDKKYGSFDSVVSLDVVEHIDRKSEALFFRALVNNLKTDGVAVVGTPNAAAARYASAASRLGHVNLFDAERLRSTMKKYFKTVMMFGSNDEIIHTGFLPMAHYLICLGFGKRLKGGRS